MKNWKYNYNNQTITVRNSIDHCELLIDDIVADEKRGLMLSAELCGTLKNGEKVKAQLRGAIGITCILTIDNVVQDVCSES